MNPYPFYSQMKFTNPTSSTFNRNLYSNPNEKFRFTGGSNCEKKCVSDCDVNCGSYCKLASTDHEQHTHNLRQLERMNADLQKQVNTLAYKNLMNPSTHSTRTTNPHTPTRHTANKFYVQVGKGSRRSRKLRRSRKRRKGGLSFWGSSTDIKPCETDCKTECPYQCKNICDRAANHTASAEERSKIESLLAQNETYRNIIAVRENDRLRI